MRVLLTGAAGFIGSHLSERLTGRGDEVIGLDNFDETLYPAAVKRRQLADLLQHPRFRFVEGDILDEPLLDTLGQAAPDVIVHLAALAGVRPSLAQPKRYQRVNIEGTLNLLELSRRLGIKRFIFASSSSVYGSRNAPQGEVGPFREDDPCSHPASPYAATKRAGELLCSTYSDLFGITTFCLRFFTVYGPRQRPEMAIHQFTRLIDTGQSVNLLGDGQSARDYTYIDDIIDGVTAAIDASAAPTHAFRIYNLGGSHTLTLNRLVELLEETLHKRAIRNYQPFAPGDVPLTWADVSRAERELNYRPKVDTTEGIRRFINWYRARSAGR